MSGAASLDAVRRNELRSRFLAFRSETGGFRGRKGNADLYYTAFALRGLFLLGGLNDLTLQKSTADFLHQEQQRELSAVEVSSFLFTRSLLCAEQGTDISTDEKHWAVEQLERFRKADGAFGTSELTPFSSTYQTFLTAVSLELLGERETALQIPAEPILQRQRADGGFVELEQLRYSGTNPTAAAVGFLTLQGRQPNDTAAAVRFLLQRQMPDGGFQAHPRIPVADLLSSFTAAVALSDLGAAQQGDGKALERFLQHLRLPDGSYCAVDGDTQSDAEYLFYGTAMECFLGVDASPDG